MAFGAASTRLSVSLEAAPASGRRWKGEPTRASRRTFVAKALTVVRFVKALESAMPSEAHSASLDHFRYLQVNVDHNWSWKSHL